MQNGATDGEAKRARASLYMRAQDAHSKYAVLIQWLASACALI